MYVKDSQGKILGVDIASYDQVKLTFSDNKLKVTVNGQSKEIENLVGTRLSFGERVSYAKSISSAGYATFTPVQDVTIPEGIEVYTVSTINPTSVRLVKVDESSIPAGEGVLLKGSQNTYNFCGLLFPNAQAETLDGNLLVGVLSDKTVESNSVYTLGRENTTREVGFWTFTGTIIPAGSAYLDKVQASANVARFLSFDFEEATAIENLNPPANEKEGYTYNLGGIQVDDQYKGIVVKGNKKFMQQ